MQRKCCFGHFSNPSLLQGRQERPCTSEIKDDGASTAGKQGTIPNPGIVLPHTETMGFEKAAAMCINPVSLVITQPLCLTTDADWLMLYAPHELMTWLPDWFAIRSPRDRSSGPPRRMTGDLMPLQIRITSSSGRIFVLCFPPITKAIYEPAFSGTMVVFPTSSSAGMK